MKRHHEYRKHLEIISVLFLGLILLLSATIYASSDKVTQKWDDIPTNSYAKININRDSFAITSVSFLPVTNLKDVSLSVEKIQDAPYKVDNVYEYYLIDKVGFSDINIQQIKINFKVSKDWLKKNKFNEESVQLQRLSRNTWSGLATKKIAFDDSYIMYESESMGFSYFAITAKPKSQPFKINEDFISEEIVPIEESPNKTSYWWVFIVAIVGVLGFLTITVLEYKKQGSKVITSDHEKSILDHNYFTLKNGTVVSNINDMISALKHMDRATFEYHMENKPYNDFALWVKDNLKDDRLADMINTTADKMAIIRLLEERATVNNIFID